MGQQVLQASSLGVALIMAVNLGAEDLRKVWEGES